MNILKRLFHFLGGLYCAIGLIAITALIVIIGTFLESYTDSHLYAAQWTYNHPFFAFLLWLFFINILFSSLRRWPFKTRHIPFLVTHLGLLMVLGGTIIKNKWGVQGNMVVVEGSASQHIYFPHSYALQIEKKKTAGSKTNETAILPIRLQSYQNYQPSTFKDLHVRILETSPHVSEQLETWMKGETAWITGYPPFKVHPWNAFDPLPISSTLPLYEQTGWKVTALRTDSIKEAMQEAFQSETFLTIHFRESSTFAKRLSLVDALKEPLVLDEGTLQTTLSFPHSPIDGLQNPSLHFRWILNESKQAETFTVPLKGSQALDTVLESPSFYALPFLAIEIEKPPHLLLIENQQKDTWIAAFNGDGKISDQLLKKGVPETLISYDGGFGGYTAQTSLPFTGRVLPQEKKDKQVLENLALRIEAAMDSGPILSPPLQLLQQACKKCEASLAASLTHFIYDWHMRYSLLYPIEKIANNSLATVFSALDWESVAKPERQALLWISLLFEHLKKPVREGEDLLTFLKKHKWPLTAALTELSEEKKKSPYFLSILAQQIFALAPHLPQLDESLFHSPLYQAHLLSAYLKAYDIEYASLQQPSEITETASLQLEAPLTPVYHRQPLLSKLEDQRPCVYAEVKEGPKKQLIALAYNPFGTGLKWPVLGDYLIRFQPSYNEIPYRVRLREGRQINYADSTQPYSYESDIIISDGKGKSFPTTLSMNRVYETWDGYRFYMAGLSAPEQQAKQVHLVINYDPAKYFLTYPGALIVTLGILLLFWMWPYKQLGDKR